MFKPAVRSQIEDRISQIPCHQRLPTIAWVKSWHSYSDTEPRQQNCHRCSENLVCSSSRNHDFRTYRRKADNLNDRRAHSEIVRLGHLGRPLKTCTEVFNVASCPSAACWKTFHIGADLTALMGLMVCLAKPGKDGHKPDLNNVAELLAPSEAGVDKLLEGVCSHCVQPTMQISNFARHHKRLISSQMPQEVTEYFQTFKRNSVRPLVAKSSAQTELRSNEIDIPEYRRTFLKKLSKRLTTYHMFNWSNFEGSKAGSDDPQKGSTKGAKLLVCA